MDALEAMVRERTISPLDRTLFALFTKQRVVELLHSFILFDGKVKKIARYQQYFAIKAILNKINTFDNTGRRAGGLVWHTQGSGKSLTMAMLTRMIKRDIPASRIIVVTDRKDLDRQIHTTFQNSEIKAGRATGGHDLIKKCIGRGSVDQGKKQIDALRRSTGTHPIARDRYQTHRLES